MEHPEDILEKIAVQMVTLDRGDIPAMGAILNSLASFEANAASLQNDSIPLLIRGIRKYLEKLILEEEIELTPLEDAVTLLQEFLRAIRYEEPLRTDPEPTMRRLGMKPQDLPDSVVTSDMPKDALSGEDLDTVRDFVTESMENLGQIEIHLVELEQDPHKEETIHAIFRSFHTIKGVSGFLNLKKINRLTHSTENLLDHARRGVFRINDAVIDIILESVDALKQLINCVELALVIGDSNLEGDMDLDRLIEKLEEVRRVSMAENKRIGELLVESGAIEDIDLEEALRKQKGNPAKKLGNLLIDEQMAQSKDVIRALRNQRRGMGPAHFQVRVETHKLDNLVDLTGELVISHAMLRQCDSLTRLDDQQLQQNLSQLTQIVSGLQKTAMSLRMVPIKTTFQKVVRLVRDLARNAGKDVGLEMHGQETEIDRNVVEELYEPLVHMIRNAVDHGIEMPDEREHTGKPVKGTICLKAYHSGGNIVIEIEDDGRGIDTDRILQKAASLDLIEEDRQPSESEVVNLIFRPGFSTADRVTDVSGRGVGMDVVKKRIEKLRGRVEIRSKPGSGCKVIISLPLTLAIIDGMIVRVGPERYIIPTLAIVESFQFTPTRHHTVQGKAELITFRDHLIPLIRLHQLFGIRDGTDGPRPGMVVVVESNGRKGGLLLDELLRREEIVIKSLGEILRGSRGILGGAILGNGRVGLILDIAALLEMSCTR